MRIPLCKPSNRVFRFGQVTVSWKEVVPGKILFTDMDCLRISRMIDGDDELILPTSTAADWRGSEWKRVKRAKGLPLIYWICHGRYLPIGAKRDAVNIADNVVCFPRSPISTNMRKLQIKLNLQTFYVGTISLWQKLDGQIQQKWMLATESKVTSLIGVRRASHTCCPVEKPPSTLKNHSGPFTLHCLDTRQCAFQSPMNEASCSLSNYFRSVRLASFHTSLAEARWSRSAEPDIPH